MTTYQNIVDYLNKYYGAGFKLFYNNPGCTIIIIALPNKLSISFLK